MAQPIQISTTQFIARKGAIIDGHEYSVRKIGAGTQLDLSREFATVEALRQDSLNEMGKLESETDPKKKEAIQGKMLALSGKLADTITKIEEIYASLFDDGEGGERSKKLMHDVGIDNVANLYNQIWGEPNA